MKNVAVIWKARRHDNVYSGVSTFKDFGVVNDVTLAPVVGPMEQGRGGHRFPDRPTAADPSRARRKGGRSDGVSSQGESSGLFRHCGRQKSGSNRPPTDNDGERTLSAGTCLPV